MHGRRGFGPWPVGAAADSHDKITAAGSYLCAGSDRYGKGLLQVSVAPELKMSNVMDPSAEVSASLVRSRCALLSQD